MTQLSLLGRAEIARWVGLKERERLWLDGEAWVDVVRTAVVGHQTLMDALVEQLPWTALHQRMYERRVDVPRLLSVVEGLPHPVVAAMQRDLEAHYGLACPSLTFALYRNGRDSVAWHRDRDLRDRVHTIVAVLSLGGRRSFQVRPYNHQKCRGEGRARVFDVGWGDLLVMGGTCQRDWEHTVPKRAHAEPRLAVMFRSRQTMRFKSAFERVDRVDRPAVS